jgi:hypothetical protein
MQPGTYTELFFLDEAAAFADGHRPCAECRHADYKQFQRIWSRVYPGRPASADAIDAVLQSERRTRRFVKQTYIADIESLPDGTYIALDGDAWLVLGRYLFRWSAERYTDRRTRPTGSQVTVLTPPSIVRVLAAGYRAHVHPTAGAESA